jgi:hypothetical protein
MNIYPIVFGFLKPLSETLISIERRTETIGEDGVVSIGADFWYDIKAIVVPVPPNTLDRTAEYDTSSDTIDVTTDFPLQGPVDGHKPDFVTYGGNRYIVTGVMDYSKAGKGFVRAICQVVDNLSKPPMDSE